MARKKLTKLGVEAIKPPKSGREEYFDERLPGFGMRVTASDVRSWFVFYRVDGRQIRQTLGRYPAVGLSDARERAREALGLVERGRDPRTEVEREQQAQARHRANTFRAVAEEFKARHLDRLRRGGEVWQAIERDVMPEWRNRPVRDIGRRDVFSLLDRLEDSAGDYARNRRLAAIRRMFNWMLERELVDANPAARITLLDEKRRQRVLTDEEIRAIWAASLLLPYPAGPFVRLLLITGQRRGEVAGMRRAEVNRDEALWTVPGERMKGGLPHEVPLPPLALAELDALPTVGDCLLSSGRGSDKPIAGFSDIKTAIAEARDDQGRAVAAKVADWRLHDLRRTMRTTLSKLRITPEIAERCIGHVPAGVRAVYDLHDFRDEKRDALERWARHLAGLVDPPASNVVSLPARA